MPIVRFALIAALQLFVSPVFATTYDFSSSFPSCTGGSGGWTHTGSTWSCSGSLALATGDNISPAASITISADAGVSLAGNNVLGTSSAAVNLVSNWGSIISHGPATIYGNIGSSSGNISLTNTVVYGTVATGGTISTSSGSVSGSLSASNGVTTSNTNVGGNVSSSSGSVSITGGTISGQVSSGGGNGISITNATVSGSITGQNVAVTINGGSLSGAIYSSGGNGISITNATIGGGVNITGQGVQVTISGGSVAAGAIYSNGGNGITISNATVTSTSISGQNVQVSISGGSVSGAISSSGGNGVSISDATIPSGSITATNVAITIENSTVGSAASQVNVASNNTVSLSNSTVVYGSVSAGNWSGSLSVDSSSTVHGVCSSNTNSNVNPGTYNYRCTGSVSSIDHYELSLPSSSVACLGTPITVTACTDSSSPCTNPSTASNGLTATLASSGGTLGSATVVFGNGGIATTTLNYAAASNNTGVNITLSSESVTAANATKCCQDGTNCIASNVCATNFQTAGFMIAAAANGAAASVSNQTAGTTSATYYLRAVTTDQKTKACVAALTGAQTVNFAYECVANPASCYGSNLMTVNGGTATAIARNNSGSVSSYTPMSLSFDANANAPFTLSYGDVGQIRLWISKAAGGSLLSSLVGSSNTFVVKPYAFSISAIVRASDGKTNPGASSASGAAFMAAGDAFSATVTALANGNTITPSFGRCDGSGGTSCSAASEVVGLSANLVAPAGGNAGSLGGTTSVYAASFVANGGSYTFTQLTWSEVGIVNLVATNDNYLANGLGACASQTPGLLCQSTYGNSGNAGRFYPKYFKITVTPPPNFSGFIYGGHDGLLGQPFTVSATAMNGLATPTITTNYSNALGFSKNLNLTLAAGGTAGALYVDTTAGGSNAIPIGKFSAGTGTVNYNDASGKISYLFANSPTAPTAITLHGDDVDSVSTLNTGNTGIEVRFGRLRLSNAYGSAKTSLNLPLTTQYWSGQSWVQNYADSGTGANLAANTFALSGGLAAQTGVNAISMSNGSGYVQLTAPANGSTGSVSLAVNLGTSGSDNSCLGSHGGTPANAPWLRSRNGNCDATYTRDPAAQASFGIYSAETRKTVHIRELY